MDDSTPSPSTTLTATGPLDAYAARFAELNALDGPVKITLPPLRRHYNLRVTPGNDAAQRVGNVLGCPLPGPHRSARGDRDDGGSLVLWLGPDEWLVLEGASIPSSLEQDLRDALSGSGAVTEQSGQRTQILVTGDPAGLLAKGMSHDLRPEVFPERAVVQSHLAQAVVTALSRRNEDGSPQIELFVRSTFARYVADWLLDAAADPLAYPA